jgi:adenosylcobinamide-phosphate synthase
VTGSALSALAVDLLVGEPPTVVHPTVAMGRFIARGRSARRTRDPLRSMLEGTALVVGGMLLTGAVAFAVDRALGRVEGVPRTILRGALLKPTLSVRALWTATAQVERALVADDLPRARALLSWHLVSRDTSDLDASQIAGATIESVAENFNDGFVAPLCAYLAGGLASAYPFRFLNTADSMLGYRTPELEWFGKGAARLDDAAGLIPARLSALFIAVAAGLHGRSITGAIKACARDARRTASPNAGWPMAAMSGALGVRLEKRNHYSLNHAARAPQPRDIARARRILLTAAVLAAVAADLV